MKRVLKLLMVLLMIVGIVFSVLNITSVDNIAFTSFDGTQQPDGCYDEPLNCFNIPSRNN